MLPGLDRAAAPAAPRGTLGREGSGGPTSDPAARFWVARVIVGGEWIEGRAQTREAALWDLVDRLAGRLERDR